MRLLSLLEDSRFVFALSVLAGFLFPGVAAGLEPLLLWNGMVLMTATLLDVDFGSFHGYKAKSIAALLGLNYILLSGLYLAVAGFFSQPYSHSITLLALMPPSIGVISLTHVLRGDPDISFYAECVAYAVSLVVIPGAALVFLGDALSVWPVLRILGWLLVVPVILSRVLRRVLGHRFSTLSGVVKPVYMVSYAISFFIVIGVNRAALIGNPWLVGSIAGALIAVKAVMSTGVHLAFRDKLKRSGDVDAVLFASFKNGGMAVIFVLSALGAAASLPLAVNSLIAPFHIVYLEHVLLPRLH